MITTVRRQVTSTIIRSATIVKDKEGNLQTEQMPEVKLLGNISEPKCKRHIRALYPDAQVYDIEYETITYAMKLDDFMNQAYIEESEDKQNG